MEFKFRLTRARVWLLVVATALVSAGFATAVTGNLSTDSAGAYHGCVNSAGPLRALVPGDSCRANEAGIDWSQAAQQEADGPEGPRGRK